nr:hypothetical protein [Tanacetum cinerariifolium]
MANENVLLLLPQYLMIKYFHLLHRDALEIIPIDQAHEFVSSPVSDAIMDFVNEPGYIEVIHFVSRMAVNNLYQPWRAMPSMINQCLTGKTSGFDRPRYPTFLTDKANLGSPTKKGRKKKPYVIPYCRFTKLIICHLGRIHNIHQRLTFLFHLAEEDLRLGNLKFVPKGKKDKVFRMPIPNELISNNIRNASYYNAYLEMVAKHNRRIAAEKDGKKKPTTAKQPKLKPANKKSSKPAPIPKPKMSLESFQEQSQAHVGGVTIQEPVAEATRSLLMVEGKDAETGADSDKITSGADTEILQIDEDQGKDAGPDPEVSRVDLAGPNPEPMYEDFMATVYLDVHGSLKLPVDEHAILEEPLSSSRTLSSMKSLDDAYTFRDQFLNDKSTKDEPGKLNMDSEVVSMVTVPIHQASSLKLTTFEQKSKTLDNTTQNIRSRVFTLELWDLSHKIDQTINTVFKEVVHIALQAPLRDRFRKMPKADMKEILHQRMFESGSYKSLPKHVALYEALKASMKWAQRDEFLAVKDKSRKRRRDDQDPLPHPPEFSKRRRHDTDASDYVNVSDSKDTNIAHLPKLKTIPDWMNLVLEEDRLETPKPDWFVPPNDLPEPENNWENTLANSFKDPVENKLLQKTGDIGSFITWFCNRIGKKKLSKSDLEGPAFKVAKSIRKNIICQQFQMEECHQMLTDQVDLVNPKGHRLVHDVSKPLALAGPPGQVTIQSQYFFNKDLEYLVLGDKGRRSALSISKLKAAHYLAFGLKELVQPLWNESKRVYDISAAKHVEDFQPRIESYQTKLNLTQPDWDASDFLFKEDYTIVSKPRAVIYRDKNDQKNMMRETEVHKFSDGTLTKILEKLDHMVKDFKLYEHNLDMKIRIWFEDDRRRSSYKDGDSVNQFRHLYEKHYNYNQAFLNEVNEEVKVPEREVRQEKDVEVEISKREGESLEKEVAKKQKIEQETKELKKCLQIVLDDDDDDVYADATPLASKIPIIDYKIHTERSKPYFKIIRADGNHMLFLIFSTTLKNFE